jgi:hypothetical protein
MLRWMGQKTSANASSANASSANASSANASSANASSANASSVNDANDGNDDVRRNDDVRSDGNDDVRNDDVRNDDVRNDDGEEEDEDTVRFTPSKPKTYHQPKEDAGWESSKKTIKFSTEEDVAYDDPLVGTKADRNKATWKHQNTEDNYEREESGPWTPHSPSPDKGSFESLVFQMTKAGLDTANANEQRNESKLSMPLDYDEDAGYFVDALQTLNDAWKPAYLQFGVLEIGEYNTRLAKAPPLRAL